ncbi:MAG: DNA alkylation repair protein [Candidatus Moranbacteria bacterium]|nr:DNA alkylation repair protein [Candidatus Moranbacteria bacterium]
MVSVIEKELFSNKGSLEKRKILSRFFKTGRGEYGEGDQFLGISVPCQRSIAKKHYTRCSFEDIEKLLKSRWHECRLTGLFLLVYRFKISDKQEKKKIFYFYIQNISSVNNWDLVDATTPPIIGEYMILCPKEKERLFHWVKSKNIWERRISLLATFAFIKRNQYKESMVLAEIFLEDKHDLIHKASGWMLREIGKRDRQVLKSFLESFSPKMPRTMLRYAIEKFSPEERRIFMAKKNI